MSVVLFSTCTPAVLKQLSDRTIEGQTGGNGYPNTVQKTLHLWGVQLAGHQGLTTDEFDVPTPSVRRSSLMHESSIVCDGGTASGTA
jgi:hypothetical protein